MSDKLDMAIGEQLKYEHKLSQELNEMKACLAWASENVVSAMGPLGFDPTWTATTMTDHHDAPTLYQALLCAWKARGET